MRLAPLTVFALLSVFVASCDGETPPGDDSGEPGLDAGPQLCSTDLSCSDGLFCNGTERCMPDDGDADARGCVMAPAESCGAGQRCEEALARCVTACAETADADGDGFSAVVCGGDDCDDSDPDRFPGNPEVCDAAGHDEDCDLTTLAASGGDGDGDGFVSAACCNTQADGSLMCGADCDDSEADVNPSASEVCNGVDDDCNGLLDHPQEDNDGDGHADPACAGDAGDDCNDNDATIYPGAPELCDQKDNDCDGEPEVGEDDDRDGFASADSVCVGGPGTLAQTDCDDRRDDVFPGGREVCNGVDDNCDGTVDEEPTATASCGAGINGVVACTSGACTMSSCTGTFDDCDDDASNGCESDTDTDLLHCGRCGQPCAVGARCEGGVCRAVLQDAWASTSTGEVELLDFDIDASGNVFVAGALYGGGIDFGSGLLSSSGDALFIGSYTSDGTPRWGRIVSDAADDINDFTRITVDDTGNVYFIGSAPGTVNLGDGPVAINGRNFLVSYDNAGGYRWLQTTSEARIRNLVATDAVYVVGDFRHSAANVFGQVLSNPDDHNIFVARLTPAGVRTFAVEIGGDGNEVAADVSAIDSDSSLLVGGQFTGATEINGTSLTPTGGQDVLFLRVRDSNGQVTRAHGFGSGGSDSVLSVTADPVTRIRYASVSFSGPVILPDAIVVPEGSGPDAVILRFNLNFLYFGSRVLRGPGSESVRGIAARDDRVYLAGDFDRTIDLSGVTHSSAGERDVFSGEWDRDITARAWSRSYGGSSRDSTAGVVITARGDIVVGGTFSGPVDFGGTRLTPTDGGDFFITRLTP